MDLLDPYKKYLEEKSIVPYLSIKDLIIYIKKFITDGRALVISAYPAMGKTYFTETINEKYKMRILDSDSSFFKWNYDNKGNKLDTVNPAWPFNYIEHIKSRLLSEDLIFVSSHEEVRKALCVSDIDYYTFVPDFDSQSEIFKRMRDRGNSEEFIKTRRNNFANDITISMKLFNYDDRVITCYYDRPYKDHHLKSACFDTGNYIVSGLLQIINKGCDYDIIVKLKGNLTISSDYIDRYNSNITNAYKHNEKVTNDTYHRDLSIISSFASTPNLDHAPIIESTDNVYHESEEEAWFKRHTNN